MKQTAKDFAEGAGRACLRLAMVGGVLGLLANRRYGLGTQFADLSVQVMGLNLLLWSACRMVNEGHAATTAAKWGARVAIAATLSLALYDSQQQVIEVTAENCGFIFPFQEQGVIDRDIGSKVICTQKSNPTPDQDPQSDRQPSRYPLTTAQGRPRSPVFAAHPVG